MSSHFKSDKCLTNNHHCEEKIVYCLSEKYLHLVNKQKDHSCVLPRREFLVCLTLQWFKGCNLKETSGRIFIGLRSDSTVYSISKYESETDKGIYQHTVIEQIQNV